MTVTREVIYSYVKGQGWIPNPRGRTAEETKGLPWGELKTGDAVYVLTQYGPRVGRVHKKEEPLSLEPNDTGAWMHGLDKFSMGPWWAHCFDAIRCYGKQDSAWTHLVGVSFPDGKDYEI